MPLGSSQLFFAFFGIVGHVEFVAAVVAVAQPFIQVYREGFVPFVSSGVVALRAYCFDFAADAATSFNAVFMKISHVGLWVRWFMNSCFPLPHFIGPDATLRGGKYHTWRVTKCGISGAEVWQLGR